MNRRSRLGFVWALIVALLVSLAPAAGAQQGQDGMLVFGDSGELNVKLIARYASGSEPGEGGTEIVAYDAQRKRAYSVNGAAKALDIVDMSSLAAAGSSGSADGVRQLPLLKRIALNELGPELKGIDDLTSVAKSPTADLLAVAVTASPKTDPGYVVFLDGEGTYVHHVQVGALPDMVTFTPDGKLLLVANEGEPNDAYTVNPEGSVAIIDVSGGVKQAKAELAGFAGVPVHGDVRKTYEAHSLAQNLEPEYIVVSSDGAKAYVALQESNAIGVLDLLKRQFTAIYGLGYKDWSTAGRGLDASDKDDAIELRNWPVLGMYMPDGMALARINGKDYILTPNEGDAADYEGFSEEARVKDLKDEYRLNADHFAGYTQAELDALVAGGLFEDKQLGRLKTTTSAPRNADGKYEAIYGFGARSFTIWDADTMSRVYDSGSDFEEQLAQALPQYFNTDHEANNFDNRSDDKGPEPESVAVGVVDGALYAFVGLERAGGVMAYKLDDPAKPKFDRYFTSRDFGGKEAAGDLAPEGLTFIAADVSPTGSALLLTAHEISGTIAVYELTTGVRTGESQATPSPAEQSTAGQGTGGEAGKEEVIPIIHFNDVHSRILEESNGGMGYAKLAALVGQYRSQNPNTLVVDAGDTFHGQTFATLTRGESILNVLNALGLDAMTAGNHDFNYGLDRLLELSKQANFPIMGANVERDGQKLLTEHTIIERGGVKIGIFGLSTPETAYKTHPNNVKGVAFTDPIAEARAQVAKLKGKADVIIALNHLGMDEASVDTSDKVARAVEGIDVIIDGHSHQVISETIGNTLIVQTGEYLKNAGIVTLTVRDGKLVGKNAQRISKADMEAAQPDAAIAGRIEAIRQEQATLLDTVVGQSAELLDGERTTVRVRESNLGNLIADAMLSTTKADLALTNGGGIRASISAGDVTTGDIITVLPFGNYIVTIPVTGAEIVAALQHGAGDYPDAKGAFPQVAGVSFSIDPTKPKGEKVYGVHIGGEPIDPARTYTLATNDFLAAGGDEYTMFAGKPIQGHFEALDEAVIAHMKSGAAVPAAGRITVQEQADGSAAAAQTSGAPAAAGQSSPQSPASAGTTVSTGSPIVYIVKPGDNLTRIGLQYGLHWRAIAEWNKLANPSLIYPEQQLLIPQP